MDSVYVSKMLSVDSNTTQKDINNIISYGNMKMLSELVFSIGISTTHFGADISGLLVKSAYVHTHWIAVSEVGASCK
jgi:hypothetical protein